MKGRWEKWLMIPVRNRALIVCAAVAVCLIAFGAYALQLNGLLTLESFMQYKETIEAYAREYRLHALLIFMLFYTIESSLALPLSGLLTVIGGYLFGFATATLCVIISATAGATMLFLATRFLLGDFFQTLYAHRLPVIHRELTLYGGWYLVVLRLLPIMPFFLANIIAGLSPISLSTFIVATVVGIIPSTVIFTIAGQELTNVHHVNDILTPPIIGALSLMAAAVLVPLFIQRYLWRR